MNGTSGPAGLILAAGESRRMGYPKALLRYRGETFLDTLVRTVRGALRSGDRSVGRPGGRDSRAQPAAGNLRRESRYQRGMTTSLQCGLRAVPPEAESVLFTLVDHPSVAPGTIDALLDGGALPDGAPLLRVPRYKGRRGHPICFSRALIAEFLAAPESGAARDIVRSHAAETEFLDLDDPGIVADIDDLEAYRGLIGAAL